MLTVSCIRWVLDDPGFVLHLLIVHMDLFLLDIFRETGSLDGVLFLMLLTYVVA